MTRAVSVFGAAMVLLGLVFISMGVPVVRMEIGWSEIIGGSVAASAGCVIMVMGVFLSRLDALQRALDRLLPPASVDAEAPAVGEIADPAPIEAPVFRGAHPLAPAPRRGRTAPEVPGVRPEPALPASLHADAPDEPAPVVDTADAPTLSDSAPALLAEEDAALHGPEIPSIDAATEAARNRPSFLTSILARRSAATPERRRTEPAPMPEVEPLRIDVPEVHGGPTPRSPFDMSPGWESDGPDVFAKTQREAPTTDEISPVVEALGHPEPEAASDPVDTPEPLAAAQEPISSPISASPARAGEAEPEASPPSAEPEPGAPPTMPTIAASAKPEPHPLQPVVVGRYNAGSASYVMYSNGMIEVETEQGTHQFASMQELKAFIEKRDAKVS